MEKVFFHISGPSLNWLSMKTLPNSLALSNVNYFLIRLKAWSFYWAVRHRFSICFLKFKAVSIVILSNSTLSGSLTVIDRIFRLYSKQFFFPSILNWNFPGFALSELIMKKILISCSNLLRIKARLLPWVYKVLPSGILQMFDFSTTRKMSLIKILKFREWHWPNHYMQNQFSSSVYGNLDNHLLTVNFL